jgi:hypothetical protein
VQVPTNTPGTTRLPPPPTNTRRPTSTPITPTATPIPTCPLVANGQNRLTIREQPSRDPKNVLFRLDGMGVPTDILPAADPLWKAAAVTTGDSITLNVIAYLGVIAWVDAAAEWYQVQVLKNGNILLLTAYVGLAGGNGTACASASTFPFPTPDPGLPVLPPPAFASGVSLSNVFPKQPPAYMGVCGLHDGPNCFSPGSTFDVVPRNVEYCIDARSINLSSECDQASLGPIPVLAPAAGKITIYADKTLAIDIDNGTVLPGNPGSREITFVHLDQTRFLVANGAQVVAGTQLGFLCPNGNQEYKASNCNIASQVPTHLAISLRFKSPSGGFVQIANSNDMLGVLGRPTTPPQCLYNDWVNALGAPRRPADSTYRGCP